MRSKLDFSGSGKGQVAGCCEHGDEPFGFRKLTGVARLDEELITSEEVINCQSGIQRSSVNDIA